MRVMGIDPGTVVVGYGVIDIVAGEMRAVDYGVVKVSPKLLPAERLGEIYQALSKLVKRHHPDNVAVEQPFVGKNISSAFAVGRAQAVAILAATNQGIPTFEYTPAKVKQRVSGYGAGSKEQIQQMVKLQLGLEEIPEPNDASDALAVALCHLSEVHVSGLLGEEPPKKKRRTV